MTTPPVTSSCLASGKVQIQVFGRLFVVADDLGKLLAVGVYSYGRRQRVQVTMSAVGANPPVTTLRARWRGAMPKPGDYLLSPYRARSAYRILSAPERGTRIRLRVQRVDLPLPDGAVVHPWRWDPSGKDGELR